MKKTPLILKMMPAVLTLPFLLTGCEELNSLFGDSSRSSGYGSGYSSAAPAKNQTVSTDGGTTEGAQQQHRATKGIPASQSETAATTVSSPMSTETSTTGTETTTPGTEKKAATGTVDAPLVPSVAPTVAQ